MGSYVKRSNQKACNDWPLGLDACDIARVTALTNRLTDALSIRHPIISAPMAFAAGGALAAAVSRAGGLGLIGGGYGDEE